MRKRRVKFRVIGERIKHLREHKTLYKAQQGRPTKINSKDGITQKEFANELGVSIDTVKNWEQGYNYPPMNTMIDICKFFDCDFDYLFGNQGSPRKYTGLSETAANILYEDYRRKRPTCEIVSSLLEEWTLLNHIHQLTTANYDVPSIQESVFCEDSALGSIEKASAEVVRLFWHLLFFINKERERHSLENIYKVLGFEGFYQELGLSTASRRYVNNTSKMRSDEQL